MTKAFHGGPAECQAYNKQSVNGSAVYFGPFVFSRVVPHDCWNFSGPPDCGGLHIIWWFPNKSFPPCASSSANVANPPPVPRGFAASFSSRAQCLMRLCGNVLRPASQKTDLLALCYFDGGTKSLPYTTLYTVWIFCTYTTNAKKKKKVFAQTLKTWM